MSAIVVNNAYQIAVLDEVDGAVLLGGSVNLYQNDITPTPESVLADFTLATYTGNGAELIPTVAPSVSDAGVPELVYVIPEFRPSGSAIGNTIFGAVILDSGGALLAAVRFDTLVPYPMNGVTDIIQLTLRVRLSPTGSITVEVS